MLARFLARGGSEACEDLPLRRRDQPADYEQRVGFERLQPLGHLAIEGRPIPVIERSRGTVNIQSSAKSPSCSIFMQKTLQVLKLNA
jgi:hypothetical protein